MIQPFIQILVSEGFSVLYVQSDQRKIWYETIKPFLFHYFYSFILRIPRRVFNLVHATNNFDKLHNFVLYIWSVSMRSWKTRAWMRRYYPWRRMPGEFVAPPCHAMPWKWFRASLPVPFSQRQHNTRTFGEIQRIRILTYLRISYDLWWCIWILARWGRENIERCRIYIDENR